MRNYNEERSESTFIMQAIFIDLF